jgi:O-antigen/teichoic acid export membrane protein
MQDLKQRTIRGSFAKLCAQGANFFLRVGSVMILARILDPKDFGLVGMVTAVTGVLSLFRDFGLSTATVQRDNITDEQISTLFWINLSVGALLAIFSLAIAPVVAGFYHEPRLFAVTAVLATGLFFNAAGVQHSAILQRQMRFTVLSLIDIISLVVSTVVGIGMAIRGYGYWALVIMAILIPFVSTVGVWLATAWIPSRPRLHAEVRSMMRFGGAVTLNSLLIYVATNFEKVLLGRFWGADAIGIYGRAYQLINIPIENLNSTASGVAFAALSRLQEDHARFKSYFLKGYSLVLALTLPITTACALFAHDMIFGFLGPKWHDAVPIFRLLAPTILVFAIVNPMAWLLCSLGKVGRLLKMAVVLTPSMVAGYFVGLPYGPKGVAFAYSTLMLLWMIPAIVWAVHGTVISVRDILMAVRWPLASSVVAAPLAYGVQFLYGQSMSILPRLILEGSVLIAAYLGMLLFVTGQKTFYLDLLRGLIGSPSVKQKSLVSA